MWMYEKVIIQLRKALFVETSVERRDRDALSELRKSGRNTRVHVGMRLVRQLWRRENNTGSYFVVFF